MCRGRAAPGNNPGPNLWSQMQAEISGDNLSDQARSVIALAGQGQHSIQEIAGLMQAISSMARVIDVDELERRLATLEAREQA